MEEEGGVLLEEPKEGDLEVFHLITRLCPSFLRRHHQAHQYSQFHHPRRAQNVYQRVPHCFPSGSVKGFPRVRLCDTWPSNYSSLWD